jgi:dienelactone hydrolase
MRTALLLAILLLAAGRALAGEPEHVTFPSATAPGEKEQMLTAELYMPEGRTAPHSAVVLLSGCYGVEELHRNWARDFAAAGHAALVVDSLKPRGVKEVCNDPWKVGVMQRAEDAYGAKRYLSLRKDLDAKRIALAGWSHGGWTLLHAIYPRKKRVSDLIKSDGAFAAAIAVYPYCDVSENFEIPLLVVIGDADDWTPHGLCNGALKGVKATPPVEYVVYTGATHSFDDPFGADADAIKAWIATEPPGAASLEPGGGFRYLGHLIKYDAAAHADARSRAMRHLERSFAR